MKVILIVIIFLLISGCTSLQSVGSLGNELEKGDITNKIKVNDEIVIYTKSGQVYNLVVAEITENEIVGKNRTIFFSEINDIKKEQVSVTKTAGAALGAYVLLTMVSVLVFFVSL